LSFQLRVVSLGKRCRIGTADDEVQSGQNRVRHQGRVLDPVCIERIPKDLLQPQAGGCGVAIPRQVDERGDVASAVIVTQEQPQLLSLLKIQNLDDGMFEFVERHLNQLIARIVLENLDHVSAGVAGRGEGHPLQKRRHFAPQHRDPQHALVVGG
jgi:hypothetical protein